MNSISTLIMRKTYLQTMNHVGKKVALG